LRSKPSKHGYKTLFDVFSLFFVS